MRAPSKHGLSCGAASVDITPRAGAQIFGSGNCRNRPAQVLADRLSARAIVFESAGRRMCIVTLDVIIATGKYTDRIRKAAGRWNISPEAAMVHTIHTHSAPGMGDFMLDPDFPLPDDERNRYVRGGDDEFAEMVCERAIQAIGQAVEHLEPVSVGYGRTTAPGWAFNRRGVSRDGTIIMPSSLGLYEQPFGDTRLVYLEGPDDPELGVICFRTDDLRMPAMLVNFACHPVILFGYGRHSNRYNAVSGDWPGALAASLAQATGQGCVPMVLNGASGNINPRNPWDPEFFPTEVQMGGALADKARKVLSSLSFSDDVPIDWRCEQVELDFRDIPEKRQKEVDEILTQHPEPLRKPETNSLDMRWYRAAMTRSVELCRARMGKFPYQVQAFRIGDAAIVGLAGEPFVEGQLAIKVNSPARFPFVAQMVGDYAGYLPIRRAYDRFGHEANEDVTNLARLAPGSLETVVARARDLVDDLFSNQP